MLTTTASTLQHIAHILSFSYSKERLKSTLKGFHEEQWEQMVKVGSAHLVLPAIYCRLQQKQLLYVLPQELETYLEDMTAINRNRNKTILKEAEKISALLKTHHINHVFLKGVALLVSNFYMDIAERMVGDIDILVSKDQVEAASRLLRNHNYKYKNTSFGDKYFEYHHDTRLIPTNLNIAAVEIHRDVLHSKADKYLFTDHILELKRNTNSLNTPAIKHIMEHNMLNFEINDHGFSFNSLAFRHAYDYVVLNRFNKYTYSLKNKYSYFFVSKVSSYFCDIEKPKLGLKLGIKFTVFKLTKKHKTINALNFYMANTINNIKLISSRISIFVLNKNYRYEALKDYKRILKLIKARFLN
tara:strand:- start:36026 stop:37096 length:1071 start_codon:yes stop_codon:yes gene_type:complete